MPHPRGSHRTASVRRGGREWCWQTNLTRERGEISPQVSPLVPSEFPCALFWQKRTQPMISGKRGGGNSFCIFQGCCSIVLPEVAQWSKLLQRFEQFIMEIGLISWRPVGLGATKQWRVEGGPEEEGTIWSHVFSRAKAKWESSLRPRKLWDAALALGSEGTLNAPRDPTKRPRAQRNPLPGHLSHIEGRVLFNVDERRFAGSHSTVPVRHVDTEWV